MTRPSRSLALALALSLTVAIGCADDAADPGDDPEAGRADGTATGDTVAVDATPPDGATIETEPRTDGVESDSGLIVHSSQHGFAETAASLDAALGSRGLNVFAVVDHARNATDAGLELSPTRVWIFGNPEAGTPLMRESRTVGIDLPMKMLVWEEGPAVRIAYNDPGYLALRHGIPADTPQLDAAAKALDGIAREAAGLATDSREGAAQ